MTFVGPWPLTSRLNNGFLNSIFLFEPNIVDLSGKTKRLWSGQASLRRSRRAEAEEKIRLKQYAPFVQRGDIINCNTDKSNYCISKYIKTVLRDLPKYLVCVCMTIRWCVAYRNDLCGTLTFDLKVK
jgi:hypothetical protein